MPKVALDHYYKFDELTTVLTEFAAEHPEWVEITSIGHSYEGRDIWLVTVTNRLTGPANEKPAFWCDGNIHASEVSATTAVLMILEKLVTTESAVLDDRAFYLVPRLCPDGAEWALQDVPKLIRSSTRPYPHNEDDVAGLEKLDIDGDGRILSMRVKDPNGPWKISELEPRLLARREPGESGDQYYRILFEGLFENFDGLTLRSKKTKQGLDNNRNFPFAWRQEFEQHGAGPYPTSESEVRAAVQAITDRPNICSAMTFHTYSGVLLRPPSGRPEAEIAAEDVWAYQKLGEKGKAMTGYPDISVYHDFRYHPNEVITGTFDEWMFEHRGVYAWTVEIWAPVRQAGITDYSYIDWFREHPHSDDVKMLQWSDDKLGGKGYVDWYTFDHPQLGQVELGGWDALYAFRNPPPEYIESEISPLADWAIWHAKTGPKLELHDVRMEKIDGITRIRFAVKNTGWLPTNVTKIGLNKKLCRGVIGEITRVGDEMTSPGSSEPDWLITGALRADLGQLDGWSHITAGGWGYEMNSTDDRVVFEWVVKPGEYELVARHDRAGLVRVMVKVD